MFPFTKPLGPNFSHLYLSAYVYVYASLEPVLENFKKLDPPKPNTTTGNEEIHQSSQAEQKKDAIRKQSPSDVAYEAVDGDYLIVDRKTGDESIVQ